MTKLFFGVSIDSTMDRLRTGSTTKNLETSLESVSVTYEEQNKSLRHGIGSLEFLGGASFTHVVVESNLTDNSSVPVDWLELSSGLQQGFSLRLYIEVPYIYLPSDINFYNPDGYEGNGNYLQAFISVFPQDGHVGYSYVH